MSELNPYEAPQSKKQIASEPFADMDEQTPVEQLPPGLGRALWLQVAAMAAITIMTFFMSGQQVHSMMSLMFCLLIVAGLLSLWNLISAIRYRIVWVIIMELIVIGLSLVLVYPARMG